MTRIGSGVSGIALRAQQNLQSAFKRLNESSLRLSTLRRINRGSDDPAGLIASESIRSELVALEKAVQNTERASSVIRVADSGLSQTSRLLNTIRGNLITAASITTSPQERKALQLEIGAALEGLDRIGSITSFGGRKLLDGSSGLDVSGVNAQQIANVEVFQRDNRAQTNIEVEVVTAAASAEIVASTSDGTLEADVTIVVDGGQGSVSLDFSSGTSLEVVAAAVNSTSEDTGVTATVDGNDLVLASTEVGSEAQVSVEVVSGTLAVSSSSASGTDATVLVNGQEFTSQGNVVSVRTDSFDADITLVEGFEGVADSITVTGEALAFAFSADPGNTTKLILPKINSNSLGGAGGRLSDLRSGGSASLASGNFSNAIEILDAASSQVTLARARAGAFEKFSIESTREVLNSSIINLSQANSQIVDTDVAAESARLIQALILVDAGIASVRLSGSNRQSILGLLGNLFSTGK